MEDIALTLVSVICVLLLVGVIDGVFSIARGHGGACMIVGKAIASLAAITIAFFRRRK